MHRHCPLCGSVGMAKPDTRSRPAGESLEYADLEKHWHEFFSGGRVFFTYARCATCGLLFAPTFFDETQLRDLYAQMPSNMRTVPTAALRRTQRGYFETFKKAGALDGGYIEIGPDVGLFTENCVREARFDPYWLVEPNRDVVSALSLTMGTARFEITDDMEHCDHIPDGSVGAIVMIQVLDHLLDPLTSLRKLHAKLRPGGKLMVVTHDESSLLRRIFGARWPAFCLQHPQIFNPRTMTAMVEAAGFSGVSIGRTMNFFPAQFLAQHLLWAVGLRVQNVPAFGGASVGLKLGNMITLATKA
jgi:Methyltransferase domain